MPEPVSSIPNVGLQEAVDASSSMNNLDLNINPSFSSENQNVGEINSQLDEKNNINNTDVLVQNNNPVFTTDGSKPFDISSMFANNQ